MCSKNFVPMFQEAEKKGTKVIGLKNVISVKEIEESLLGAGIK